MNHKQVQPKINHKYYCVCYRDWEDRFIVDEFYWTNDFYQREMLKKNMVFETEEECLNECIHRNDIYCSK